MDTPELYKIVFELSKKYIKSARTNPDVDLFRVTDIYDAVGPNQCISKQWLVEEALPYIKEDDKILIQGSWYGILSYFMRKAGLQNQILNVDLDPVAKRIGQELSPDSEYYTDDAITFYMERRHWITAIANTSVEHMEPDEFEMVMQSRVPGTLVMVQSNNNHSEDEHINVHESVDHLADVCSLDDIYYKGSKVFKGKEGWMYERHLVIGR